MKNLLYVIVFTNLLFAFSATDISLLKEEGDCPKCDLSYANLEDMDLTMSDFSDANLSHANFSNVLAHRADFTNANLSNTVFKKANLKGANFTNAILKNVNFYEARIWKGNFTNAYIDNCNFDESALLTSLQNFHRSYGYAENFVPRIKTLTLLLRVSLVRKVS